MSTSSQIEFQPSPTGSPTPLSALRGQQGGLPEAEARVAQAVLTDPALVTSESVSDLAARAGSSTATVVRMCRRVGFDGFYRFKIALAHEVGMNRQFGHPSLTSTDSATVVQSALLADAQEIADSVPLVDSNAFDLAVEAITNATDVLFAGVGTSGPLAQLGALRFLVLGVHAIALQDVQAQDLAARLLRPGSACVLISHTGSSKETVGIAKSARAAGASTIAITSFARSPLAKACDIVLSTGNRSDPRTLELFTSRAVHVSLLGALHAGVAARLPIEASVFDSVSEVTGKHLY
jgi:DNA-binding MurR/RpiR family transcriptional regulator